VYWLGDDVDHQFALDSSLTRLDWGAVFYTPNSLRDPAGRWLMWSWVRETRSRDQYAAAGWASCLILSREISLDDDSSLIVKHAIERQGLQTSSLFDSDGSMTAENSD